MSLLRAVATVARSGPHLAVAHGAPGRGRRAGDGLAERAAAEVVLTRCCTVHLQPSSQDRQPSADVGLGRAERQSHRAGHLLVGEPVVEGEADGAPLLRDAAAPSRRRRAAGRRAVGRGHLLLRTGLLERFPQLPFARGGRADVRHHPAGDAEQPAGERALRASKPLRPRQALTNTCAVASSASPGWPGCARRRRARARPSGRTPSAAPARRPRRRRRRARRPRRPCPRARRAVTGAGPP
jgi:hypothetical protein